MSSTINRRSFLKAGGQFAIGAALADMISQALASSSAHQNKLKAPGKLEESIIHSICGECRSGCGVTLRLVDGIPVGVRGNALHPLNRGGVCLRGASSLQMLYNPDRLKQPRERVGKRGQNNWNAITYSDAMNKISGSVEPILAQGSADKVWILVGNVNPLLSKFLAKVGEKLQLSHLYRVSAAASEADAFRRVLGSQNSVAYDFANSKYILSFGCRLLEDGSKSSWFTKVYSELRERSPLGRTKIVQIDPQLTPTGIKADEWIPAKPNAYGDIALCLAHVILAQGNFDSNSAHKYIDNFADLKKSLANDYFSPASTAERTGLEAQTLVRLAQEISVFKPAVAVPGERILWHDQGAWQFEAVYLLNVLIGAVGAPGGLLQLAKLPALKEESSVPVITAENLVEMLNQGPAPDVLIVAEANPLYLATRQDELRNALAGVNLVVSLASFPSDTSEYSDIVVPVSTAFERWQMSESGGGFPGRFVSVSKPVIEPLYETRDSITVLSEILGKSTQLEWQSSEQFIKEAVRSLYESNTGQIFSESLDVSWIKSLKERGWSFAGYSNFDDFWTAMVNKGGWWDPEASVRKTKPTKAKFSELAKVVSVAPSVQNNKDTHNLWLNLYTLPAFGEEGRGAYSPMLLEISASHVKSKWGSWVEINPDTARKLGIKDRDYVRIKTINGTMVAQARVYVGTHPDIISVAMGMGHTHFGRFARNLGINPLRLLERSAKNPSALLDTQVVVTKIENGDKYNA